MYFIDGSYNSILLPHELAEKQLLLFSAALDTRLSYVFVLRSYGLFQPCAPTSLTNVDAVNCHPHSCASTSSVPTRSRNYKRITEGSDVLVLSPSECTPIVLRLELVTLSNELDSGGSLLTAVGVRSVREVTCSIDAVAAGAVAPLSDVSGVSLSATDSLRRPLTIIDCTLSTYFAAMRTAIGTR